MNRRVVITGLGVITSIGIGWKEFWDSLLKGKSGISPVKSFDTSKHFTHNGGEVKDFRPEKFIEKEKIPSLCRATQLAFASVKLAVQDTKLSYIDISNSRIGTCVGITSGAIQVIEHIDDKLIENEAIGNNLIGQLPVHSTPGIIATEFGLNGPNFIFSTACAAGNYA